MPTNPQHGHTSYPAGSEWSAKAPNPRTKTYFWRHEFRSTAEGAGTRSIPHFFLTQPIVGNLDMAVKRQEDVVELKISIDNPILMEIL